MSLSYEKIKRHKYNFLQLTGINVEEFEKVVEVILPVYKEKIESQKKRQGRNSRLKTLEDKVLCVLIYYRSYITHSF